MSLHILMARIFVRVVSSYVCTEGFCFVPSAVCGQKLNAFAGFKQVADVAVSQAYCMPSIHTLFTAKRNYKLTRKLSHLTVEEQFILRVSSMSSL